MNSYALTFRVPMIYKIITPHHENNIHLIVPKIEIGTIIRSIYISTRKSKWIRSDV